MKIINKDNPDLPVGIESFLATGEYDQGDVALIDYDDLYDALKEAEKKGYLRCQKQVEDAIGEFENDPKTVFSIINETFHGGKEVQY